MRDEEGGEPLEGEESLALANEASADIITLQRARNTINQSQNIELPEIAPKYLSDKQTIDQLHSFEEHQVRNQLSDTQSVSQSRESPPFIGGRISRVSTK